MKRSRRKGRLRGDTTVLNGFMALWQSGRNLSHNVHADIEPFSVHLREEYLYDMDPAKCGNYLPCTVFALTSYAGHVPTFMVTLADRSVFSYMPASALLRIDKLDSTLTLSLSELVYHNCPKEQFAVHSHKHLRGPVSCLIKQRSLWLGGKYVLTMDWGTGNEMLHLIDLNNGQFAFLPHHKLQFRSGASSLAPYRKSFSTWKV